jgi:hypothetical protein
MAIRIYKKEVEIAGLKRVFEKICVFDKKNEMFKINYPHLLVDENIIKVEHVYGNSMEEVEKLWREKKTLFELLQASFKEVILYKYEENWDSSNGHGVGFIFSWGVFKRVELATYGNKGKDFSYYYLRGGKNHTGAHPDESNWIIGDNIYDTDIWKEIPCTEQAEAFFEMAQKKLYDIHLSLMEFFVHSDLKDFKKALPNSFLSLNTE